MEDERTYLLRPFGPANESLMDRHDTLPPARGPSLLEYLEQTFTEIEMSRAERRTEEGGLALVIALAAVLSACLLLALSMQV